VHPMILEVSKEKTLTGFLGVPMCGTSRGAMLNGSSPFIFASNSNLSKPVDCSKSDGTVPGFAPSPWMATTFPPALLATETLIERVRALLLDTTVLLARDSIVDSEC